MACRVARSFPKQTADLSEKGGRPVSDFSLPSVQSAITVLLIDAHKEDREYWIQRLLISSPDYVGLPPVNSRETRLRKEVSRLKRALAEKTLEVDFFTGALREVKARRQRSGNSGGTASTPISET